MLARLALDLRSARAIHARRRDRHAARQLRVVLMGWNSSVFHLRSTSMSRTGTIAGEVGCWEPAIRPLNSAPGRVRDRRTSASSACVSSAVMRSPPVERVRSMSHR
jgi:hypothetical protein